MTERDVAGFLWGVATGAHQTEGNNLASDWWAMEHAPGSFVKEPSGDAVDSYHRWREDMDLAAGAGFTDYRFGIEWSRVERVEGFLLAFCGRPLPPHGRGRASPRTTAFRNAAPLHPSALVQRNRRLAPNGCHGEVPALCRDD